MQHILILWVVFGVFGASAAPTPSYLDLNLRQNRYLGEEQNSHQGPNYTFLAVDLNFEGETSWLTYKVNPIAQGALEVKNEFYGGVPEIYFQPPQWSPALGVTVGRQKRTWSRLDEEFNLGVWQPQLRWDYLAPKQQGLIGIFVDSYLTPSLKLSLFASPLYLPDQGPNFELQEGHFTSANRWFVPPPKSLFSNLGVGKNIPLYYELDRPAEEEVIWHSSLGASLTYHDEGPWWWQLGYAYKPRNQFHLGVECTNCATVPNLEVTALIHPEVIMQHVLTLESGIERNDDRGWVSVTGDFPSESKFPNEYEQSPLSSLVIFGASYERYLYGWIGIPSWLKFSYMRTLETDTPARKGMVNKDSVQSSLDRYPFRNLAAVDWKIPLRQRKTDRLDIRNRYSYALDEEGGWLSSGVDWTIGAVTWNLGVDILGSNSSPVERRRPRSPRCSVCFSGAAVGSLAGIISAWGNPKTVCELPCCSMKTRWPPGERCCTIVREAASASPSVRYGIMTDDKMRSNWPSVKGIDAGEVTSHLAASIATPSSSAMRRAYATMPSLLSVE